MKFLNFRLLAALMTFVTGISAVTFWYLRSTVPQIPDKIVLTRNQIDEHAAAWKLFLSFENQNLEELDNRTRSRLQENAIDKLIGDPKNIGQLRLISKITNEQGQIKQVSRYIPAFCFGSEFTPVKRGHTPRFHRRWRQTEVWTLNFQNTS